MPIHIRCQNAAVLMSKHHDAMHFEVFELSPLNKAIYSTPGRLQRQFPGPAFLVTQAKYEDPNLQETIAHSLSKMSHQSVAGTKPRVKKARQQHDEDRDTTDPKMVTEFFTAFLRPCGNVFQNVQIQKNTREEVLWLESQMPWRRSPLWLLVRVSIQLVLERLCQRQGIQDDLYKQFMVYYMSFVLNFCSDQISSERQYIMNAKIARRLKKLDFSSQPAWFVYTQETLKKSHAMITKTWHSVMENRKPRLDQACLASLNFEEDIGCSLPGLNEWIEAISQRQTCSSSTNFQPQTGLPEFGTTKLPSRLGASNADYKLLKLVAFESWVHCNLEDWLLEHLDAEDTCELLDRLSRHYHELACPLYSGNPEATSVMYLTLFEIWIACDKSAIQIHPLLANYDPCIPTDVVESFVLPHRSQMERLPRVEEYMHQRLQSVRFPESSILEDFGTRSCFSVRYFDQSREHQHLRYRIEEHASSQRKKKELELEQQHNRYRELYAFVDRNPCEYHEITPDPRFDYKEQRHSNSCKRCASESEANSLSIDIHEWPLPSRDLETKTTVFELKAPRPFTFWREATVFFLFNVLGVVHSSQREPRAKYSPKTYCGLRSFFASVTDSPTVGLLSEDKPHERTHRRQKKIIDVTTRDVCLENGMNFRYYDDRAGCFFSSLKTTDKVAISCTYRLPQTSTSLQKYLFRPSTEPNGPSPNTVIASQDCCPQNLSLEEYKALCSMPLGVDIQYHNILRQLAMPSVAFNKVETCTFIFQILFQAGPSLNASVLRRGHQILDDNAFTTVLLAEIDRASTRIKENWESAHELTALIFLTQRVISLSNSTRAQNSGLEHLSGLRSISLKWATRVREKTSSTDNDTLRRDLIARSTQLALICASTYDLERSVLSKVLQNECDASTWIQCSMMIHDRKGILDLTSESFLRLLFYRWQIVSYRCYPIIAENVLSQKQAALDLAIKEAWAAYRPRSAWSVASGPGAHWLVNSDGDLLVHFNLLLGELLVNGRPLTCLPSDYEQHASYKTLFGRFPLEVMPSELPGMTFSGQRKHIGHTIHLGKKQIAGSGGFDLCVRAINEKGQAREIIPARLLAGAFPDAFVEEYVHWYDLDGDYVDFCPRNEPWKSSNCHWQLQRQDTHDCHWGLFKGDASLINIRSTTARTLSSILQPIEREQKLHCKLNTSSFLLEIDIPRLRLSFTLGSGDTIIRSRQYLGMQIDADQSLETLVGLRNKLMLVRPNGQERKVLIPEGHVTWKGERGHVTVDIGWQAVSNVHVYTLNSQLGQLAGNGSLQSKLMVSYLHALTSFCLPDPFTSKTGTEQSLSILRSASVRSFSELQPEHIAILRKIAELTPGREFYPANERVMQKIKWQKGLGCLPQHDDFHAQVTAIFNQDDRMKMFYPESQGMEQPVRYLNGDLLRRGRIRSSSFRVTGFGAENFTTEEDSQYSERGRNYGSAECLRVFTLCKTLHEGVLTYDQATAQQDRHLLLWKAFSAFDQVSGPVAARDLESTQIKYDSTWLQDSIEYVISNWCRLHQLLRSQTSRPNSHQLMMWLSTLAFSNKIPMPIIECLAVLYIAPNLGNCSPPSRPLFQPSKGYEPSKNTLSSGMSSFRKPNTPESSLLMQQGEKYHVYKSRVNSTRDRNRARALNGFIANLQSQWPILSPEVPSTSGVPRFEDYFNVSSAMKYAQKMFSIWFHNRELGTYLKEVCHAISQGPARRGRMPSCPKPCLFQPSNWKSRFHRLDDVLHPSLGPPPVLDAEIPRLSDLFGWDSESKKPLPRLLTLVDQLELQASSDYERQYVRQLRESTSSLQKTSRANQVLSDDLELEKAVFDYLARSKIHYQELHNKIMRRMTFSDAVNDLADNRRKSYRSLLKTLAWICVAPRYSSELFLQQLTRERWSVLSKEWKTCFVAYGQSITSLQRAKRLVSLIGQREDLVRELENPGHSNWDPYEYPESLLLEIENGLSIREPQEQIARQVRDTPQGQNAVMQLNMGEGKSSVIVPIVASALADGSCLVRVLVAKPQSKQMFQMLVSKLGGLLGRRVYQLPVSRSLKVDQDQAIAIEQMCLECKAQGGVLLVQPEHILSLKLMCLENFIQGKTAVGQHLLRTLELFRSSSRDVVDESDENFSVKFELIYTMGTQRGLELSPQRWILIQQLLELVRRFVPAVKAKFPQSVEVEKQCAGSFPRTRLLHEDATTDLFQRIAEHICNNGIDSLPVSRQPKAIRRALLSYILKSELSPEEIAAVEGEGLTTFWTDSTKEPLLLLRGLLAGGVLASCLGHKRWRVNFGPDSSRTKLSVPYRAKDSPAPRSEFSHPDVVVVLTCLSYYYSGLDNEDLFSAFQHLLKSDQAEAEYQQWMDDAPGLSHAYRQLNGINLQDRHQCLQHIFPQICFSKGAIDYFLAHIVFPKEMKEFPDKLSASGWDIGEIKAHPTAGFSGTNDSRVTLPLSVTQLDLPAQNHTNALVLENLLRPENTVGRAPARRPGQSDSDAQILLDKVVTLDPPTQVILDVGAQILEMTNLEVAQTWLKMLSDDARVQAVVFVSGSDEICVIDRTGLLEPLQISPFATQLEACLVFLDEAHTRGIDLKLPQHYRAAVTLGAGITKDKLVQGKIIATEVLEHLLTVL